MILAVTLNPAVDKIYLLEAFDKGEVHRPKQVIASAGGKGLNVARVATLIGEEVVASGFLGGSSGDFIRNRVKEQGFADQFVEVSGETRTCVNISEETTNTSTEVLELGPTITDEEVEKFKEEFKRLIEKAEVVTLSGSLPKGVDVDIYKELVEMCIQSEKKVLLDSSGDSFIRGLEGQPYIVKPNKDEIKQIYKEIKTKEEAVEAIKFLKGKGIQVPIISMGKDGCIAGIRDEVYHFTFKPLEAVNAVGSGDSFIAGCATGINRGYSMIDTIKLGCACGSANTQFAQTGYVTKELVEEYFGQIKVEKIK